MALIQTVLGGDMAVTDTVLRVASLTGFAVNQQILVDREVMVQVGTPTGLAVPVRRGLDGTVQAAHTARAIVTTGLPHEFSHPAPGQTSAFGPSAPDGMQSRWTNATYGLAGALAALPGVAVLNGTAAIAMTLAAPSAGMEGAELTIVSASLFANTVVVTGISGAAGPTGTFAATGGSAKFKAVGGKWAVLAGAGVTFA
jgi:hypothetical protein